MNNKQTQTREMNTESSLVHNALHDQLFFTPLPPGMTTDSSGITLTKQTVTVDATEDEFKNMLQGLEKSGLFTHEDIDRLLSTIKLTTELREKILHAIKNHEANKKEVLAQVHALDDLANLSVNLISRAHEALLDVEPLTELHFQFTNRAKVILAIGWDAMLKRGIFPLPPEGGRRIHGLQKDPLGAMHFVSASDLDEGYHYTLGIALSPEAQALNTIDVSYGLDGELIVPGQAVSPIPPFLAMATRLFSVGLATSSNISEEVQSIPIRNYPHPTADKDLEPKRRGLFQAVQHFDTIDQLISDVQQQLWRNSKTNQNNNLSLPPVKAVIDVTQMTNEKIHYVLQQVFKDKKLADQRESIALYFNIESANIALDRVTRINSLIDVAAECGIKYVAIADNEKDDWLPNLLEYLEPYELNLIADYSDGKHVIVIDGRPVDPIYTAATSAQRIQSVYTTLAVDILKMGMWLCLDALTARIVYRELLRHPHIPKNMLLMPIGIVEPWNAFVDNRNTNRTPRAILDPFAKIKFMIEEAKLLGIPSLLTDTRHKETWVLLGRKTDKDEPHAREDFIRDSKTNTIICRTEKSAIPLLSWEEFMECERLARKANIFLGQAGSVETLQLFRIISDTTYDAARERKNPATAIWTAETERVLSTRNKTPGVELQSLRSATVSPFLAVINRGFESHAKLDGWLHYLEEESKNTQNSSLRKKLGIERNKVNQCLQDLLVAQTEWQTKQDASSKSRFQKTWDEFRSVYLNYHHLIKDNFLGIRTKVANKWTVSKKVREPSLA